MDIGGGTSLGLEGEEGTDIGAAAAAVWLRTGHELGFGETERGVVVGAVGDAELVRERQILAGGAGEGEFAGGEVVGEAGEFGRDADDGCRAARGFELHAIDGDYFEYCGRSQSLGFARVCI